MDNITPHYVNLGILKFPDNVKFLFFISYVIPNRPIL